MASLCAQTSRRAGISARSASWWRLSPRATRRSWRRSPSSSRCTWPSANPQSLTVADLDQAAIERERAVLAEKAGQSGKTAEIIAKMVEGGLRKFHQDVVLLEQLFVIDGKTEVEEGHRGGGQAGRRAGPSRRLPALRAWRGYREEIRRISPPRWLPSSRSSRNRSDGARAFGSPRCPRNTVFRGSADAVEPPLSPCPCSSSPARP